MKASAITAMIAGAGLFAGAIAWSLHQETGFILASFFCDRGGATAIWITGLAALALLTVGTGLSWLALRRLLVEPNVAGQDGLRARHFLAQIALMAAAIFLFAVLMQGSAAIFLPACVS